MKIRHLLTVLVDFVSFYDMFLTFIELDGSIQE